MPEYKGARGSGACLCSQPMGILSKPLRRGFKASPFAFPSHSQPPHRPVLSARPQGACYMFFHSLPLDRKSPPITEVKTTAGKIGKETEGRKGAMQEKKQLGIRDKEDKKGARMAGKEACGTRSGVWGGRPRGGRNLEVSPAQGPAPREPMWKSYPPYLGSF